MTKTKKLFAVLLVALMVLAVMPVASFAKEVAFQANETKAMKRWDNVWAVLDAVEAEMMEKGANRAEVTMAVYKAALNCPLIDAGSITDLNENEFSFTTDGMLGGYNYRVRNFTKAPARQTNQSLNSSASSAVARVNEAKGSNCGNAQAADVLLVQPYSGYDSSFTQQYNTEAASIASALGGTLTTLKGNNATGPAIASNYTGKGVVIYDSHGNCIDSKQTSYLDLHTSSGLLSSDYTNGWAYNGGSFYGIDGRYIKNYVSGTLSNPLVWMAICEGMKVGGKGTTGTALLQAGAGCVYGYSQSVTFTGDYEYEATFWTQMKNGKTVAQAIATMKSTHGIPDPYGDAYPIVMSAQDSFPSNPDGAQTVNCDWELFGSTASYTVTATTNNSSYGTVSVNGYVITASPKTGYYAAGYTVTSGTATVVQNGNTFTVTPSSDCTVRINFAAKTTNTVTFIASGTTQGTQTAYSGDSITLPTSVNVNPTGWTFVGWVTAQVSETTNKPTYYAPGASYTVSGNATLYALYTRVDATGGADEYQLVTGLEDGGTYVIVNNSSISGTTGYAVGNTNVSGYSYYLSPISVTINSDNTCTVSSSNEAKVLWVAAGNDTDGYSFYNEAVGKYMVLNSSEYLTLGTSGVIYWKYDSSNRLDNQVDSEGYYYLSYATSPTRYTTGKIQSGSTTDYTVKLYKLVSGSVTYYNTDPAEPTPVYFTVTFKDWDGTVLSTQEVLQGEDATAPANPSRVGYTFTGWDVAFTNVQSDLVVTAQYMVNTYKLTINYKYADGTTAASTVTQNVAYGNTYSVTSPTITGYTPSQAVVSGTMGAAPVTVTVTYTANNYTLTINYVDENGTAVADPYVGTVAYGETYSVTSPVVAGYTTEQTVVTGTMGAGNVTVTVVYTENQVVEPGLVGDVDCDGDVDFDDVTLLNAYLLNAATLSEQGLANANVNGDSKVSSADVVALNKLILGSN